MARLRLASLALVAVLAAACGGAAAPTGVVGEPTGAQPSATASTPGMSSASPTAPDAPASAPPTSGASGEPTPTGEPTATEEAAPTDEPIPSEEATPVAGGADACSGSDANREFFEGLAKAVDWPVLCAVLPRGWFVSQGAYRLANGGKLAVSYKGPGGASLALSEGAFCQDAGGCVPHGAALGAAALGPLDGTLYQTSDGFAVIAAPGENPSWLLTTKGLDRSTTTTVAASLAEVAR